MRIGVIASNYLPISESTTKGTEIFVNQLIKGLGKFKELEIVLFASGDTNLPVQVVSIDPKSSSKDVNMTAANKHIIFELALISKAVSMD